MNLETTSTAGRVAAGRYGRGVLVSSSLLATGLVLTCAHSAFDPGTVRPLLLAGFTLILTGVFTWTAAAYVHDRAAETTNGT